MRWLIPAIAGLTLAATGPGQAQQAVAAEEAEDRGPSLSDLVAWPWTVQAAALRPHPEVRRDSFPLNRGVQVPEEVLPRALQLPARDRRRPIRPDPGTLEEAIRDMERTISGWILRSGSGFQPTHGATGGDATAEVRSVRPGATPPSWSASTGTIPQAGGSRPPW